MQFAEVAVDTKTSLDRQTFTYNIPPELLSDIKIGVLVLVPFHGRKLNGIILSLKSHSPFAVRLKSIIKVIDQNPVLDSIRLELAKWISEHYLTPIGEVIFSMIPNAAIRQINNDNNSQIDSINKNKLTTINAIADIVVNKRFKKNIYTLYNRMEEREETYIKLIEKSIAKNKKCLVLFPSIEQARIFQNKIDNKNRSVLYHSQMTKTQRYLVWNDIRNNKYQVVIGTRPTVFALINNLGLIIIDQVENFSYKEDQSSRYHSVTVAKRLSELTGANLILGSLVPSIETYHNEQIGKYQRLQSKPVKSKTLITKRIIDLNTQKNKIISWELEQSIVSIIENNGKVLLFSQRKGEGSSLICQDCGYVFKCNKCNVPYSQATSYPPKLARLDSARQEEGGAGKLPIRQAQVRQATSLFCHRCNTKLPTPQSCPECRSVRLKSLGIGIDKIQKEIFRLFPNVKSISIDVDTVNIQQKIIDNQIIIASKKITDFPQTKFDLIGVINLDNLLNLPDYKSSENVYLLICNLLYQCKNEFILQTYNPENESWDFMRKDCPQVFLNRELVNRKNSNFPPYNLLIKLTYQNSDESICLFESQNIKSKIENLNFKFIGPSPSFISKIRSKFNYQIIVFINSQIQISQLRKIIITLPKGWKIDVDPISLI